MPRKCSVGGYRFSYDGELETITCFGISRDKCKRDAWRKAFKVVLENSEILENIGVRIKHWSNENKAAIDLFALHQYSKLVPHAPGKQFLKIGKY